MNSSSIHILLADDDKDDGLLFKEALEELPLPTILMTVNDGEQLMELLAKSTGDLPAVLFLDLNMPRKNGYECLTEIKLNDKLKKIPVIIYTTSYDPEMISHLYNNGAQHYIRKPAEFTQLKQVILDALLLTSNKTTVQPSREKFILQP